MCLRDKAVTVRFTRSMFNPYRFSQTATEAAENSVGKTNVGRFNKRLLKDCKELKEAISAFDETYRYIIKNTLPWMDDGVRVLPTSTYQEFMEKYGDLRTEAMDKVRKLEQVWDSAVAHDADRLGTLFNVLDYPTADQIAQRFKMKCVCAPIPSSEDFRVEVDEETKADLEDAVSQVESSSGEYLLKEILEPVQAMAAKLHTKIGEEGSVFRNTLVTNVTDVCERARKLNIAGDPRVEEIIGDIEKSIGGVEPDALRLSDATRERVANDMSATEKKLAAWF
jgi:hypothetical protein